jgi:hypothetical protein
MEPQFERFLVWVCAIGIVWLSVLAIFATSKGEGSESKKALWIAFIICSPLIGPAIFWLFAKSASSKEELEAKEALLKAKLNASVEGKE